MIDNKLNYQITYNEDGVYLSVLPEVSDTMMTQSELLEKLSAKQLANIDYASVEELVTVGTGAILKIAPPQTEKALAETVSISVSDDKMEASISLHRGEPSGHKVTTGEVLHKLKTEFGIIRGFDVEMIDKMIDNQIYDNEQVVVRGQQAIDGVDGKVILHFETDFNKIGAETDGRIDFKQLSLFANVNKGSVVASKTRPVIGKDGWNIFGDVINAKIAQEAKFNYGKNILVSNDGDSLLSTIDGKADVVGNKVVVSKVYVVDGNVDMSVGNIDFAGDVVITGSVLSGFTVNAGGCVEIYGIVEGAHIYADKNIRVIGGFLGNGKGMLSAGGSVFCKNVEHGIIRAAISIEANNVIHSNLYCDGYIKVNSDKSSVIGGNICSGTEIILNNAGTVKGTATTIKIGLIMDVFKRMSEIQKQTKSDKELLQKLNLAKSKMVNSNAVNITNKVKVMNEIIALQSNLEKMSEEKVRLEQMIKNAQKGKIEIHGRAYNGVDIIVNDVIKRIDTFVDYTMFTLKDGEIHERPCK